MPTRAKYRCPQCGAAFTRKTDVATHLTEPDGTYCRRLLAYEPTNLLPSWCDARTPVSRRTLVLRGSLYVTRDRREQFTAYGITPTGERYALACRRRHVDAERHCRQVEDRA